MIVKRAAKAGPAVNKGISESGGSSIGTFVADRNGETDDSFVGGAL